MVRKQKKGGPRPGRGPASLDGKAPPEHVLKGLRPFAVIVVLAAALRIGYTLSSLKSPFFDHLDLDSRFYDLWAKDIAGGNWIGKEVFFMGPLYPYFLAVIYKVFGTGLVTVKIFQDLLGALTAGVTYLLGRLCFGTVAGLAAGFLAALYVPFIFYDNSILLPVLATLLNVLMLYFLYLGILRGRMRMFLAAGIFAGLSATGNASVLAFGLPAVAFLVFFGTRAWRPRIRKAALFALGAVIVVMPVVVRNYVVGHDFVPLTSNAGLNFYIGNNEKAMGAYVKPEGLDVYTDPTGKAIAEAAEGRDLKPSEVSAYWGGRAMDFIKSRPTRFLSNLVRKVFFFWSVFEVPQIEHLQFEKRYSWILRIPSPTFGIVCPLGILGMILSLRKRRETYLLFLFVVAYSATIVAFFVVARYRLPMIPALLVFAGYTVQWWAGKALRRNYKPLAYSLGGFLLLVVLVHANFYGIDPMSGFAQSYYRLGLVYEKKGDRAMAVDSFRKAVETDPSMTEGYVNLGIALSRDGRYAEAAKALRDALDRDAGYAKALYNLGLVYAEQARDDSALVLIDRALEERPDYSLALVSKAGLLYETARFGQAESLMASLISDRSIDERSRKQMASLVKVIPDRRKWTKSRDASSERSSDLWLLKGDNLMSLGVTDRALEAFERAIRTDSTSSVALFQAATVYFNKGDLNRARSLYEQALRMRPDYPGAHFALGAIAFREGDMDRARREFEGEVEINPGSAGSHANLAMIYEEYLKEPEPAARHLERYIELTGGSPELRKHLKDLKESIDATAGG
jgi:tetratricopeptide (TPR) repeat protein